jgi:hypothetical protein
MKTMQLKISKRVTPLALAALLIPAISSGFPNDTNTYQIISETVTNFTFEGRLGNDPANDPSDPKWSSATATPVPLEYLILASANAQGAFDAWEHVPEQARNLSVTSIHDNQEILFRVSWDDATEDVSKGDVPLFFDALAVMIPYPESDYPGCVAGPTSEPMIHMGMRCDGRDEGGNVCTAGPFCKCCPVNLHFWRPDKEEVENIVTNGMGTTLETAETDDPTLFHAAQSWDKGKWTVIMGRALKGPPNPQPAHPDATDVGPGGHMVTLRKGESYDVVWANWDGARDERNGSKFIGLFGTLIIAP